MAEIDKANFDSNKEIDLVSCLPSHYAGGEVETFLQFFEDFLNDLYVGFDGIQTTETATGGNSATLEYDFNISSTGSIASVLWTADSTTLSGWTGAFDVVSAGDLIRKTSEQVWYTIESISDDGSTATLTHGYDVSAYGGVTEVTATTFGIVTKTISILEKIKRLTELHDPDLIDTEYVEFFARNLGYDVNINRTQLAAVNSDEEVNKYLRFAIKNLPNWYRIKTTDNAIKVMLYSFGLVADLYRYWTEGPSTKGPITSADEATYRTGYEDFDKYIARNENDPTDAANDLPRNYFLTPHFTIKIDVEASDSEIYDPDSTDFLNLSKIIDAIDSIRPINTVFEGFSAVFGAADETLLKSRADISMRHYIYNDDGIGGIGNNDFFAWTPADTEGQEFALAPWAWGQGDGSTDQVSGFHPTYPATISADLSGFDPGEGYVVSAGCVRWGTSVDDAKAIQTYFGGLSAQDNNTDYTIEVKLRTGATDEAESESIFYVPKDDTHFSIGQIVKSATPSGWSVEWLITETSFPWDIDFNTPTGVVSADTEHTIHWRKNGSELAIFVDGRFQVSATYALGSQTYNQDDMEIGARSLPGWTFTGCLRWFSVYNRALSNLEIYRNHQLNYGMNTEGTNSGTDDMDLDAV